MRKTLSLAPVFGKKLGIQSEMRYEWRQCPIQSQIGRESLLTAKQDRFPSNVCYNSKTNRVLCFICNNSIL